MTWQGEVVFQSPCFSRTWCRVSFISVASANTSFTSLASVSLLDLVCATAGHISGLESQFGPFSQHSRRYTSFQSASYIVYKVGCHLSRNELQPWDGKSFVPDSWCTTAYTAAATVPFPLESQDACRCNFWTGSCAIVRLRGNLSSPGQFPLWFQFFG